MSGGWGCPGVFFFGLVLCFVGFRFLCDTYLCASLPSLLPIPLRAVDPFSDSRLTQFHFRFCVDAQLSTQLKYLF